MIRLSDNLEINKPSPIDDRLGVFVSTASALTSIAEDRRYIGLTVIVDDGSGAVEYWFQDGVTDVDLVAKSQGGGGGVPYTGATQNVDLGEYQIKAGQYEFDQTPTQSAGVAKLRWNDTDGTLDLGLKGGNVNLQIGQEEVIRVVNNTGASLLEANYQAVKVSGAQGQRLAVTLAQANNDANSASTIGLVTETIANNQEGFITTNGLVRNVDTTGALQGETWSDGDTLYLSGTTAGAITNVKPSAPIHTVIIGYVVYAHQNNGKIFVKVDNGYELGELHNVSANTPSNRDGLYYNTSNNLWEARATVEADLPSLSASKITSGTFDKARIPKVIPAVAIAGSAVTSGNNTNENIMQTLTIPANTLNVGDVIRIGALNTYTTTGTKAVRVRFGTTTAGTAILSPASLSASVTSTQIDLLAVVTGSTTLRFSTNAIANAVIYGANTGALQSQTIDRTQDISFIVTIQKATGTDTVTCESAFLEIITA